MDRQFCLVQHINTDRKNEEEQMKMDMPHREVTEDTEGGITEDSEDRISSKEGMEERREP